MIFVSPQLTILIIGYLFCGRMELVFTIGGSGFFLRCLVSAFETRRIQNRLGVTVAGLVFLAEAIFTEDALSASADVASCDVKWLHR